MLRLHLIITFAAVLLLSACAPTSSDVSGGTFAGGAVHTVVTGQTGYSRSQGGSTFVSADPAIALGSGLGDLAQANSAVQRLAEQLPNPSTDPARQLAGAAQQALAAGANASSGRTLGTGSGDAAARARAAGLSGVVVEVSGTEMRIYGSGAATQVGGNRVVVALTSTLSLIDVSTGEVLARSTCRENTRTRRAEVEAAPNGFVSRQMGVLAQACVASFTDRVR
ncbi:hypothetical protein [Gymnodinialimonas hymeniacidonis]|uniref:hypothetical protein n=1 Tax=Gymnodinialimonas hymeniacidonis TaxID=3126508 RepID=UPI0034C5DCD1